jgi:tRNA-splicing ligase RtcB
VCYEVMESEGGRHIKMWTRGVPVEDEARAQLVRTSTMPFIFRHLAVMPDVHVGKGSPAAPGAPQPFYLYSTS